MNTTRTSLRKVVTVSLLLSALSTLAVGITNVGIELKPYNVKSFDKITLKGRSSATSQSNPYGEFTYNLSYPVLLQLDGVTRAD